MEKKDDLQILDLNFLSNDSANTKKLWSMIFSWPIYQYLGGNRVELDNFGVFQNCLKFIQHRLLYNQWWIKILYNDLQELFEEQRSKRQVGTSIPFIYIEYQEKKKKKNITQKLIFIKLFFAWRK